MPKQKIPLFYSLAVVLFSVLIAGSVVWAVWQEPNPSCSPPDCNVDAPLTVGSATQTKTGDLTISNGNNAFITSDALFTYKGAVINGALSGFSPDALIIPNGKVTIGDSQLSASLADDTSIAIGYKAKENPLSGQIIGSWNFLTADPDADSNKVYTGARDSAIIASGNDKQFTNTLIGLKGAVRHLGTGDLANAVAVKSFLYTRYGGDIGDAIGFLAGNLLEYPSGQPSTIQNLYGVKINNGDVIDSGYSASTVNSFYGVYVDNLFKATNNFAIYTEGSTKSYFGGAVGIGDPTPDTGAQPLKLDVEGAIGADWYCDKAGNNCVSSLGGGGGPWTDGGSVVYVTNTSAKVGIGTTLPGYPLDIINPNNNGSAEMRLNNDNATPLWTGMALARQGGEKWFIGMNNTADNSLRFRRNGTTDDVVIDISGNVGLGVSPVAKLSFPANTVNSGGINFGTDTNLYRSAADTLKTDDDLSVLNSYVRNSIWVGPTTPVVVISSNRYFFANYGATTTPSYTFYSDTDTGILRIAPNSIGFITAGVSRMTLSADGNIGINTGNPQSALQINGYTQLGLTTVVPPSADCDNATEYGRMKVDSANSYLYVCVVGGWKKASLVP